MLITLIYLRRNRTQEDLAVTYGVSQPTISRTIAAKTAVFAPLRWPGWEEEVGGLLPDQGLSVYPQPFSREGKSIGAVIKRPVPLLELFGFYDAARQLGR